MTLTTRQSMMDRTAHGIHQLCTVMDQDQPVTITRTKTVTPTAPLMEF